MRKPEIKLVVSYAIVSPQGSLEDTQTFNSIGDVYSYLLNLTWLMADMDRVQPSLKEEHQPSLMPEQDNAR